MTVPLRSSVLRSSTLALVVVVVLWSMLARAAPAQAGGTVGNGTPGSCDEAALTARLGGGGSVTFNCGGPKTILVLNQKSITQTTSIDGGGQITLTGGLATRLFNVSSGVTLTVRNIVLDAFYSPGASGGAIASVGTLVLENSTIQFSQTDNSHGGGAIYSAGPVFIRNSTLRKNSAGSAGALFLFTASARAEISNSAFDDNKTTATASGYGGAIWVGTGAHLNVVDSQFARNSAQFGGAVYVNPGATAAFRRNSGNTLFESNVVTHTSSSSPCGVSLPCSGGAIYNEGALDVNGVSFSLNRTPQTISLAGFGGAIASYGTLSLYNGFFVGNRARFGGALHLGTLGGAPADGARAVLEAARFDVNVASRLGGALFTSGYTTVVTATNLYFLLNSAGDSGGAAARFNATLSIFDSSFVLNSAATAGGGLYVAADTTDPNRVLVQSTTFDGNQTAGPSQRGGGIANGYSGAFYANGGLLLLGNATLVSNTNGLFTAGGNAQTVLSNTVLSNGPSLNCDGAGTPVTSNGHNFSSDNSCALNAPGDQKGIGLDPLLGPLKCDLPCYRLPLPGSPLIDTGSGCPPLDQRGALRNGPCDKGAVEFGGLLRRALLPLIVR